jgi:hypothetical protein
MLYQTKQASIQSASRRSPPHESELALEAQWGHAHELMEVVGEAALITETEISGYLADLGILVLEGLASGLDSDFHDEGLRATAKGLHKLPVQLAGAEMDPISQILHTDALLEMLADVGQSAVDVEVRMHILHRLPVALRGAHDADDAATFVLHGHLMRDEPVGDALRIKKQLHDVQARLAGLQDLLIIAAEVLGEALGEDVKILLADQLGLLGKAEALHEVLIGTDDLKATVFGKERDAWQMIKEPVELALGRQSLQELGTEICGWHGVYDDMNPCL